jgi:DNA-binding MarR family transcriptional regulator
MSREAQAYGLDHQVSFAVYGAASRMARLHKPYLEPLGLTFPQYLVMLELYSREPPTVGELGAATSMDTGTITPLLKKMQSLGFITRTRDPGDERRVLVGLTPLGESLREEVWKVPGKIDNACQLSKSELADLNITLRKFANGQ